MVINLHELTLENLAKLQDGAAVAQLMQLIEQAVRDVENRPGDKRARKVILQLEISPKAQWIDDPADENRKIIHLHGAGLTIKMDARLPSRHTIQYDCGVNEHHRLVFNPDSPQAHLQPTLPFGSAEGESVPFREVKTGS